MVTSVEPPIVVGVDGSEASMRAVDWAADEAGLRGVGLRLVHASSWGEEYEGITLAQDLVRDSGRPVTAETVVEAAAHRALRGHTDLEVSTEVLFGEPVPTLLSGAANASALVLGSRGRSGIADRVLGSVSLTVAARASCPVMVLRGSHDNRATCGIHRRIVLGVGEGTPDDAFLRFAYREAQARGAVLEAVRAWRRPVRKAADSPLMAGGPARPPEQLAVQVLEKALSGAPPQVRLHRRTVEGTPHRVLLGASATADLVVIGARRRHGHPRPQLSRVAHVLLHHGACPIAVVPHWR
ncbi:universal stress protein [Streptomyces venezuelae]|uniref:universal stress protein n=1 Tax=Streptomyces venezuelae TaxID=54571 RepID=UPI00378A9EAF